MLDITLKNMRIQKKYLENINSLLNFKPYQNVGMQYEKNKTIKIIKRIENVRLRLNKTEIFLNLFDVFLSLNLCNEKYFNRVKDIINHLYLISIFGAEVIGPNLVIVIPTFVSNFLNKTYKITYNDDCDEINRELYET